MGSLAASGDLAFYADVLGKPNSSGYWCHLCQLCWKEWNKRNHKAGEKWTLEKMRATLKAFKESKGDDAIKGVRTKMHYTEISPQLYVCPELHMEFGLVNKAWDEFTEFIDEELERLDEAEVKARLKLVTARTPRQRSSSSSSSTGNYFVFLFTGAKLHVYWCMVWHDAATVGCC